MGWQREKDMLHRERKQIINDMQHGMFSRDQMNMKDCRDKDEEHKRVNEYDGWKSKNQKNMQRFHEINRKFKQNGEEGRVHSLDDVRNRRMLFD